MEYEERLREELIRFGAENNWNGEKCEIYDSNNSKQKLKDALVSIGCILSDKNGILIARVKCGFAKLGTTYIAAFLENNIIYALAMGKEGIIKQNLSNKAINLLKSYYEIKKEVDND